MKTLWASIRVILGVAIAVMASEYFFATETGSAIATYTELQIFLVFFTLVLIVAEVVICKVNAISDNILTEEQKQIKAQQKVNTWWYRFYQKMLDQKSLDKESEIILDHNYDGIQELDNNLPPWWVYLFYGCIIFAGIYLVRYHILGADFQKQEYENEQALALEKIEAYKKANPNLIDINNVTLLTEEADIQEGKDVFMANCIACHAPDGGGGIGPNLTDQYWILGGGIKNVFKTVTEGGREGQGMVPWKGTLSAKQRQQVSSYVISLQGTTPANPKNPQGELWSE